jgi:hypothetical protein
MAGNAGRSPEKRQTYSVVKSETSAALPPLPQARSRLRDFFLETAQ